jgi:hypothetical protein
MTEVTETDTTRQLPIRFTEALSSHFAVQYPGVINCAKHQYGFVVCMYQRGSTPGGPKAMRESKVRMKFKTATHKVMLNNRKYAAERAIKRLNEKQGDTIKPASPFLKNPLVDAPGEVC